MNRLETAVALVASLLLPHPCDARSWFVNQAGTGDAPTIQAAADSSSPGDTVLVAPGTYQEQVQLTSAVTLRGTGSPSSATIDAGSQVGSYAGYCIESWGLDGVSIENLRLVGAAADTYGYGGYTILTSGRAAVRDCVFENEVGGGAVEACGDLTIEDSTFRKLADVVFGGSSLVVESCRFEDVWNGPGAVIKIDDCTWQPITARISRNTFLNSTREDPIIGYGVTVSLDLEVSENLFAGNGGPAVAYGWTSWAPRQSRSGTAHLDIRDNTIARGTGYSIGWDTYRFGMHATETIELRRNAITGNGFGLYAPQYPPYLLVIECNDVWANGVNWTGVLDPTGTNGNISLEPKYCDAAHGNFTVATNSPLRAQNNSCQVQIGAFGVGCGPVSVASASWGMIKALYR